MRSYMIPHNFPSQGFRLGIILCILFISAVFSSPSPAAGETPAHPNVEPLEKVRPAAAYMLSIDDIKEFPKYEQLWKEIFQIR